MKIWVKLVIVISGLAILAIVGGYFLGQLVPGLSSSLSQSLSITILSVGIASSSIAVLSGRSLEEYYKRRDEEKRVKSSLVSYLSKLHYEIVNIGVMFEHISRIFAIPPPDPRRPEFAEAYQVLNFDAYLLTQAKELVDAGPIDTSYYRKNVEDHLLFMHRDLAVQATLVDALIFAVNDYREGLSKRINKELPLPKIQRDLLPPNGFIVYTNLYAHRREYELLSEFAKGLRNHAFGLKTAILDEKKVMPDSRKLFETLESVRESEEAGDKEFFKAIFPSQSSFKLDPKERSKSPTDSEA